MKLGLLLSRASELCLSFALECPSLARASPGVIGRIAEQFEVFERKRLVDSIAVLIDVIDLCIEPWIMALAATQILPMRRRGLFLALELIGTLLWAFVFGTVLSWFWTGLVVCGILEFVLPLLFWRGSPFRKVSALFVIQLCSIVAGAVVWTCWEAIFGMPIPEVICIL